MSRDRDRTVRSDEHNSRGIELADRGWLDEAIKEFKKAIELDPESAHAHDNLATVYSEKKLYREALKEYLTALELEPESATAHYNLACSYALLKKPDLALKTLRRAVELGYRDFRYMREDRDLETVRHDPRSRQLLREYESR